MSKELIPNQKQIVLGITKAFNKMETAKKGYVYSVIELGERLNEAKEIVPFGQWETWLNDNSELSFGRIQASKFMKIARNKTMVLEFFNNEDSVDNLTKAITDATPEQIFQVDKIKKEEADRIALAEANKALAEAKAAIDNAKKQDDVIDGVFEEIKAPEIEPEPEEDAEALLLNIVNDQEKMLKELISENTSLTKAFESNDPLMQALEDLRRTKEISKGFEDRMHGLQNERVNLMKQIKHWRTKYENLEKANASA
jgi:hypothetical protein